MAYPPYQPDPYRPRDPYPRRRPRYCPPCPPCPPRRRDDWRDDRRRDDWRDDRRRDDWRDGGRRGW